MAVPISPEELRFKRNSILKHQSQMENAPFLGDDDRLFWQRAEERNRATAPTLRGPGPGVIRGHRGVCRVYPNQINLTTKNIQRRGVNPTLRRFLHYRIV